VTNFSSETQGMRCGSSETRLKTMR
jgi:hypothetical protein